jgi:hypothetical protein
MEMAVATKSVRGPGASRAAPLANDIHAHRAKPRQRDVVRSMHAWIIDTTSRHHAAHGPRDIAQLRGDTRL